MKAEPKYQIKEPKNLSTRVQWLRDYFFKGAERKWRNELIPFTTGTDWDILYDETNFYAAPEMYSGLSLITPCLRQTAYTIDVPDGFWKKNLHERRVWFLNEAVVHHIPREILPGDLIAGGRFNALVSKCLTKSEAKKKDSLILGKKGLRAKVMEYHNRGYGNLGSIGAHIIPGYETVLKNGFKGIYEDIQARYEKLSAPDKNGKKGACLKAMMTAAEMPKLLADEYAGLCRSMAGKEQDTGRKDEFLQMEKNLRKVPWLGADTFWEAVQALWISHMLVMTDEGTPGPGLSFGRIDQYLYPFWENSLAEGMDREFGKEILKCFWMHCNSSYDFIIDSGNNNGINSAFGQIISLSGMGRKGEDMTNDLTYACLEVIDEMSPILEPKPNVRLHKNSPDELIDRLIDMISTSQGAPFILNFDERSMAGLLRQAKMSKVEHLINEDNVYDYATVGCVENTMVGNDRSGTVDNNINLLKAVELALNNGDDLIPYSDFLTQKVYTNKLGLSTGDPQDFKDFEEFFSAFEKQLKHMIKTFAEYYEISERSRSTYSPASYLSCLVKGCAESATDVTAGGAQLKYTTMEGVTFATTVDSVLAIKHLVYDKKECTMDELVTALKDNWKGHEVLQAKAINKAPKYGRDDDEADAMGRRIMDVWANEVWNHKIKSSGVQFRGGMLSWNYWITDSNILAASADGREKGKFLSNAICPSNGADIYGPTANANSVGKVLGGKDENGGDYKGYRNSLPNGTSHTISFNTSILKDAEHKSKFREFLRGYVENGGTALQVNMLNTDMLMDAQKNPDDYKHLLVRVTGYNSYFALIGKELQDEIIARECHSGF